MATEVSVSASAITMTPDFDLPEWFKKAKIVADISETTVYEPGRLMDTEPRKIKVADAPGKYHVYFVPWAKHDVVKTVA